jgi:beta-glucanase (GH16 family)
MTIARRAGATAVALALAAPVALPAFAAGTPPAPPVVAKLLERIPRAGTYAVVVTVPPPIVNGWVTVVVGSQARRKVATQAALPTALLFDEHFAGHSFTVRTTSSTGDAIRVKVAASIETARQPPPPTPTGATGASGVSGAATYTAPAHGPYKRLVFADEFNGPTGTTPNPSNWTEDSSGGCGPGSLSSYTQAPQNAALTGAGALAITAEENGPASRPSFTSAQLDSDGHFSFQYGEIEARIKLPSGSGMCSGFWMVGDSASGGCFPQCGEIDIMEAIAPAPSTVYGTLHGPYSGSSNFQQWQQALSAGAPFTSGFHTYGVIWQPGRITWTLDGVPYGTATPASLPAGAQWVFNGHPFHLLLDLSVGGWPGPPAANASFPQSMLVDWVRVYD